MKIADKTVVSILYKLEDESGNILDQSNKVPMNYLHGSKTMIPGLEKRLEGKEAGEKLEATIAPEEAYGNMMPQLVQKLPMSAFEGVENVEPGMEFQATGEEGETMLVRVESVEGDEVTINGNHPLAGITLNFNIEIVDVREATEEELEHGHAHGEGGHHHH